MNRYYNSIKFLCITCFRRKGRNLEMPAGWCYDSPECISQFRTYHSQCLGTFCGRSSVDGSCGMCGWGERSDGFLCVSCEDYATAFQWCFIIFYVLVVFVVELVSFYAWVQKWILRVIVAAIIFILTVLSVFITLQSFHPTGSLSLYSCRIRDMRDWYTQFNNPENNHCGNEGAYPMYSLIFAFCGYNVVLGFLALLPLLMLLGLRKRYFGVLYPRLWINPLVAFVHFLVGPLLYYSYPYIILVPFVPLSTVIVIQWARRRHPFRLYIALEYFLTVSIFLLIISYAAFSIFMFFEADVSFALYISLGSTFGFHALIFFTTLLLVHICGCCESAKED